MQLNQEPEAETHNSHYRVTWSIDAFGVSSHRAAAEYAFERMTAARVEPDGACVFEVADFNTQTRYPHTVDLASGHTGAAKSGPIIPQGDARSIIDDLRGALAFAVQQIEQMQGLFDDDDGQIAQSLEDAKAADARAGLWLEAAQPVPNLVDAATALACAMDDALSVHIYCAEDGEFPEPDSPYMQAVEAVRQAMRAPFGSPIRLGVMVEGGAVQSVFSDRPLPGATATVFDYDTDGVDPSALSLVTQGDNFGPARAVVSVYDLGATRNVAPINTYRANEAEGA